MEDALIQAQHSAESTKKHLQGSLATASAVEALILLPLIEAAARLEREIGALFEAKHIP